jgi:RimJ/RimL family protein N-acetyltransferase
LSPLDEIAAIATERLLLSPLRAADASELVEVLGDERLHEFIGGRPDTLEELQARYARLLRGSPNSEEVWLNWIARRRFDSQAVGTMQATLTSHDGRWTAQVAWVVGVPWQGQGFASEAARALVEWLRDQGAHEIVAHIHPRHRASGFVAARAGLSPTDQEADGECVWRLAGTT